MKHNATTPAAPTSVLEVDIKNVYNGTEFVADVVLVKNDPADVPRAIELAQKVRAKIKQNLFWAAIYNVTAIPIAGGVLCRSTGFLLRPEWATLSMRASTITVTLNALLLNRVRFSDDAPQGRVPMPPPFHYSRVRFSDDAPQGPATPPTKTPALLVPKASTS